MALPRRNCFCLYRWIFKTQWRVLKAFFASFEQLVSFDAFWGTPIFHWPKDYFPIFRYHSYRKSYASIATLPKLSFTRLIHVPEYWSVIRREKRQGIERCEYCHFSALNGCAQRALLRTIQKNYPTLAIAMCRVFSQVRQQVTIWHAHYSSPTEIFKTCAHCLANKLFFELL